MLQENIFKEAPRLNKKIVIVYRTLVGEFCIVNEEFSDLQYLMNTLRGSELNKPSPIKPNKRNVI